MDSDGFVRIKVNYKGKRGSSISLDDVLFNALRKREGGYEDAVRWLRSAVLRIEDLERSHDPLVHVQKVGLSRLVQRLTILHLLEPAPTPEPAPALAEGATPAEAETA